MDPKDWPRDSRGALLDYAWPGGYPVVYTDDGADLCGECASDDCNPTTYYIHFEGPTAYCDECGMAIESAYGEPEEVES